MMKQKFSKTTMLGVALALAACSNESLNEIIPDGSECGVAPQKVCVVIPDFGNVCDDETSEKITGINSVTRAAVDVNGGNYKFVWAADDEIGIFPNSGGQVAFPMTNGAGTQNAVFDGGGWGLKPSATYSAYYPVVREFDLDKSKIPMDLSKQKQVGNANYNHISRLAYMSSPASTVDDNGQVTFNFEYNICVLHLLITVSEAKQFNRVLLMASDNLTTQAALNLTDNTVISTKELPLQVLELQDVEVADVATPLDVYMVIRPVDLTDKIIKARIYADDGTAYVINLTSRNYEAGNFYHSTRTAVIDEQVTGLREVYINMTVPLADVNKEEWVTNSTLCILQQDGVLEEIGGASIKGRGNASWVYIKKPYKFKLDSKYPVLNNSSNKKWTLLAECCDRSLLRTTMLFEVSKACDLPYTPAYQHVDLYFNGSYNGTYMLTDQIEKGKERINIKNDGFIIEHDTYATEEPVWFETSTKNFKYSFKYPDSDGDIVAGDDNYNYIKSYMDEFENALYNVDPNDLDNGYRKYIDVNSFAKWYIVMELLGNCDPNWYYVMNQKGSKLEMYPAWDAEWCLGLGDLDGYGWIRTHPGNPMAYNKLVKKERYFLKLLEDDYFKSVLKQEWSIIKENIPTAITAVQAEKNLIQKSQQLNFEKWPILETYLSVEMFLLGTWEEEAQFIFDYFEQRYQWFDQYITDL